VDHPTPREGISCVVEKGGKRSWVVGVRPHGKFLGWKSIRGCKTLGRLVSVVGIKDARARECMSPAKWSAYRLLELHCIACRARESRSVSVPKVIAWTAYAEGPILAHGKGNWRRTPLRVAALHTRSCYHSRHGREDGRINTPSKGILPYEMQAKRAACGQPSSTNRLDWVACLVEAHLGIEEAHQQRLFNFLAWPHDPASQVLRW
jgi:hypothetical protein